MDMVFGRHMRSGTTLLWDLCNSHPDIVVTLEFGCFTGTGKSYLKHCREMLRRCWEKRRWAFLDEIGLPWGSLLGNYHFVTHYLLEVGKHHTGQIQGSDIQRALRHCITEERIVGDKFPYYVLYSKPAGRDR